MKSLIEIGSIFFKMGIIAFGGPAAHIAMVEDEIVSKRKWMSSQEYLDIIGATNLIPGPNSTEVVIHCGLKRGGIPGMLVAGLSFLLPAVVITGILAWFYVKYGSLPSVNPAFEGIKPAVLVIILMAIIKLGKKAIKSTEIALLGIVALVFCLLRFNEISALLIVALLGVFYFAAKRQIYNRNFSFFIPLIFFLQATPLIKMDTPLAKIFVSFLKVGSILYGSGYVLIAYLDAELVSKGMLSSGQLLDAIAVGQLTPGPVLSAATFVGYLLGGFKGAVVATLGIFIPSFFFVGILNKILSKLRHSKIFSYFLDSVNIAAVAIMAYILIKMGMEVLIDWKMGLILLVSSFIVYKMKKGYSLILVIVGALMGYLLHWI